MRDECLNGEIFNRVTRLKRLSSMKMTERGRSIRVMLKLRRQDMVENAPRAAYYDLGGVQVDA